MPYAPGPTHALAIEVRDRVRAALDSIVNEIADADLMPPDTAQGTVAEYAGRYCAKHLGSMFGQVPEEDEDDE